MPTFTLPVTGKQAKARAQEMRQALKQSGTDISYSEALERVAHDLGYRDWNTASARLSNQPDIPFQTGDEVSGRYLNKPFTGKVLAVRQMAGGSAFDVTVHFDEPVDVVDWESFSALRQRVNATVSSSGASWSKTSDGRPHLVMERRIL